MKVFLQILIGCTLLACTGNEKTNNEIASEKKGLNDSFVTLILEDTAILRSDVVKTFVYFDSLYFGHPIFISKPITRIQLDAPVCLKSAGQDENLFFIDPGDTINIKMDENRNLLLFVKNNKKRTVELNFFRQLIKKCGKLYNYLPTYSYQKKIYDTAAFNKYEKDINLIFNKRMQYLDSVAADTFLSIRFVEIARNCIQSAAIKDSLCLFWSNKSLLNQLHLYDGLLNEKLQTIKKIPYQPNPVYFNSYTVLTSIMTTNYLDYELQDSIDVTKRLNFIDTNFNGLSKDFLLSSTLYMAVFKSIPVSKKNIQKFLSECSDSNYKRIIIQKVNEQTSTVYPKGSDNILFTNGKMVQPFQELLNKYKGRVILLDFWASWCAPCRAEMPYTAELKNKYPDNNIIFLSVSMDTNIRDWQNANKEEGLGNENSFLFLNADKAAFVQQNKISTIPRYIIIGKDGKIINANAPRPSDPELIKLLNKYISQ